MTFPPYCSQRQDQYFSSFINTSSAAKLKQTRVLHYLKPNDRL
nr:MAG TPA: hypothetical protein [Caudoviricetes sp.]